MAICFTTRNPEEVILTSLSRLVRCFSSGLCSTESGGWVIRVPGLRGEGDTDMVTAGRAEWMPEGLLQLHFDDCLECHHMRHLCRHC